MKSPIINAVLLLGRVILPPFLCAFLIMQFEKGIDYHFVWIFGVAIVLLNRGKTKYIYGLSFLFSTVLSFAVLFLSMGLYFGLGYIISGGDTKKKVEGLILGIPLVRLYVLLPIAIISPLFMFYAYRILFKIKKTLFFNYIQWTSIIIILALGLTELYFENDYLYIFWELIMASALQLILYQKELKNLFVVKK